jgi:hypothetical protein
MSRVTQQGTALQAWHPLLCTCLRSVHAIVLAVKEALTLDQKEPGSPVSNFCGNVNVELRATVTASLQTSSESVRLKPSFGVVSSLR